MCGIAGFIGSYSEEVLDRLSVKIAHRGPDEVGKWYEKESGIGVAHRRLSIIDLSPTGSQPMWNKSGSAVIVFNGEIYNFKELRKIVEEKGVRFRGTSDTEVIITLYDVFGADMLQMLNGIFAFAIWDKQKKKMLVARDGFGVKPFYYSLTQSGFCFASELKAIVEIPDIDKTINPQAIHYYLSYLWSPDPFTPFKKIMKLEPGTAMFVDASGIIKKYKYYEIPIGKQINHYNKRNAIELCRETLNVAVKRQMVADVEVATFLSGGLDSTAISYFASNHNENRQLKCFTIRCKSEHVIHEGLVGDLPYAEMAARHIGVDLRIVDTDFDLFSELPMMIYHLDEPQADSAPLNVYRICRQAQEAGIKVLLSGAGGDDVFTGYRRHQALYYRNMLKMIPADIWKLLGNGISFLPDSLHLFRRLKKGLYAASYTDAKQMETYFRWLRDDLENSLYSNDFKELLHGTSPIISTFESLPEDSSVIDKMLFLEMKFFLADHNLNYTDKMSMATGVEVRVPFLDPDLVRFAFSLPSDFKQHGATGKWILKKAMEQVLPKKLIYRSKTGFGIPIRKMLKEKNDIICHDYLSKKAIVHRGIFDYNAVKKLIDANLTGRIEAGYTIFSLICIEIWMRLFVDNDAKGL